MAEDMSALSFVEMSSSWHEGWICTQSKNTGKMEWNELFRDLRSQKFENSFGLRVGTKRTVWFLHCQKLKIQLFCGSFSVTWVFIP